MSLMDVATVLKCRNGLGSLSIALMGGPGSGGWGHEGRTGKVGGSKSGTSGLKGLATGDAVEYYASKYGNWHETKVIENTGDVITVDRSRSFEPVPYDITTGKVIDTEKFGDSRLRIPGTTDAPGYDKAKVTKLAPGTASKKPEVEGTSDKPVDMNQVKSYGDLRSGKIGKGYFIVGNKLYDASASKDEEHTELLAKNRKLFGVSDKSVALYREAEEYGEKMWREALAGNTVRVREFKRETNIQTSSIDNRTLRRLQKLYDKDLLDLDPNKTHYWESMDGDFKSFSAKDFLSVRYVNQL